jgi:hypothetical protein
MFAFPWPLATDVPRLTPEEMNLHSPINSARRRKDLDRVQGVVPEEVASAHGLADLATTQLNHSGYSVLSLQKT